MPKGIIFIGGSGSGKTHQIKELMQNEIGGSEAPIVLIDGLTGRLMDGETLQSLTHSILTALPDARIVFSVQSLKFLSADDMIFAQKHFDVKIAVEGRTFLSSKEDEILIEGMPVRLLAWQKDSPQFFNDMNQFAIHNASFILKMVYGNRATLRDLHRLLTNVDGFGELTVSQAKLMLPLVTDKTAKELAVVSDWFMHKYFDNERDSTFNHCAGARAIINRLCITNLDYQTA